MLYKLLTLLGDEVNEPIAQFALDSAIETVLNYCNIKKAPPGLENTIIRMAMDMYKHELSGGTDSDQGVTSVNMGDTSVSFGGSGEKEQYLAGILKDYQKQLNKFRRVGFR